MLEKTAKLTLASKQLADEIADMRGLDCFGLYPCRDKRGFGNITEQFKHPANFAINVTGKSLWAPLRINTSAAMSVSLMNQRDSHLAHFVSHHPVGHIAQQGSYSLFMQQSLPKSSTYRDVRSMPVAWRFCEATKQVAPRDCQVAPPTRGSSHPPDSRMQFFLLCTQ